MTPDDDYSKDPGDYSEIARNFPPDLKRMDNLHFAAQTYQSLAVSPPEDPTQSPSVVANYHPYPADPNMYQNMYNYPSPWLSMHIYQTPQWPFAMPYGIDPSSGQPSPISGPNLQPMMPPMLTSPVFGTPQMYSMGSPSYPMMGAIPREEPMKGGRKFPKYVEDTLVAKYVQNRYCERKEREALSQQLNLKPEQVKIWFQNRRYKDRKRGVNIQQNSGTNQQGGTHWNQNN